MIIYKDIPTYSELGGVCLGYTDVIQTEEGSEIPVVCVLRKSTIKEREDNGISHTQSQM